MGTDEMRKRIELLALRIVGALDREVDLARAEGLLAPAPVSTVEASAACLMAGVSLIGSASQAALARSLFDDFLALRLKQIGGPSTPGGAA